MKAAAISLLVICGLLTAERAALACSCVGYQTFEQAMTEAPIVAVGRVSSIGSFRSTRRIGVDPPVIELDVLWVVKGALAKRVDVWNASAGSSCGGAWAALDVGSHAVIALRPVRARNVAPEVVLKRTGVHDPQETVLTLAASACGSSRKDLSGPEEVNRWIGRKIS